MELIDRLMHPLRQTREALAAFVDHGTRWPRLPLAAAMLAGILALPGTAAGSVQPPPVDQVMHMYERLVGDPGALRQALTPDYEVGLGDVVYSPMTHRPVPWDAVVQWAEARGRYVVAPRLYPA